MTITELEEKSGVARRTIHFYVREGLLPAPEKPGGGARYDEEHLLRLLIIRDLQVEHYRLSAIRERLDAELAGATGEQMRARLVGMLSSSSAGIVPKGGVEELQDYLAKGPFKGPSAKMGLPGPVHSSNGVQGGVVGGSFSFAELFRVKPSGQGGERPAPPALRHKRQGAPVLSGVSWVKFSPEEGVEVQVREDVLRKNRKKILAWLSGVSSTVGKGEKS